MNTQNLKDREERIGELVFLLTRRDRDSVAAIRRMIGAIAVVGKNMNAGNRSCCAAVLREVADDVEAHPQPAFEGV